MSTREQIAIGLVVLLGYFFRIHGLFANSFHSDEALFASWARHIAVWKDPLLATQAVDKPPLLFYLQALFYPIQGPVEWAARLPNFMVSIWLVPLTAVLFWRIYHDKWGLILTAVVVAFSPLAVQFSGTAFIDPLLTFWLVLSIVTMMVANSKTESQPVSLSPYHPFIAGFIFGLAAATKYQAWLFLPLLAGLGWLAGFGRRHWLRWLVGLGIILAFVVVWEFARTGSFSLWSNQVGNFGGVRLSWSWQLWPRLLDWGAMWQTAVSPFFFVILLGCIVVMLFHGWRRDDGHERVDGLLILFLIGYMLLHWVLAVPVWDRYLLPLVPLVAVIIGRGWMIVSQWEVDLNFLNSQYSSLRVPLLVGLTVILVVATWPARDGRFPIGGTPQADHGAGDIAAFLQDAPYGTVLYDHWYSWQWRYHLFDKGVFVSWFPHGEALARELSVFGYDGHARYLALPATDVADPIIRAVNDAGFRLQLIVNEGKITLYQIVPTEEIRD